MSDDNNTLCVLYNNGPYEWALVEGQKPDETSESTYVVRFDNVPAHVAEELAAGQANPRHHSAELHKLPHKEL